MHVLQGSLQGARSPATGICSNRFDKEVEEFFAGERFRTDLYDEEPRQVALLFGTLCWLLYFIMTRDNDAPFNINPSLVAVAVVFLMYCILQVRDGLVFRPHPAVWRVIHGMGVIYVLLLVALSVQDLETARFWVRSTVGETRDDLYTAPPEPLNCTISAESVWTQLTSLWFKAHVFGWTAKMILLRNFTLCMVWSILFEFLEISLQFIIPEFQECWWDSIFLDALGANLLGLGGERPGGGGQAVMVCSLASA
eukprot:m.33995 g.33995  ORF g.33995 m.33995 type:complete len:253 (-) comp5638_c0_seq3:877-1635(-)